MVRNEIIHNNTNGRNKRHDQAFVQNSSDLLVNLFDEVCIVYKKEFTKVS